MNIKKLVAVTMVITLIASLVNFQTAFAAVDKVILTDFAVDLSTSNANKWSTAEVSTDGNGNAVFTINNTEQQDYEFLKSSSSGPKIKFKANTQRVSVYDPTYQMYFQRTGFQTASGDQFNYLSATIKPYETDPNYVIAEFTLYETDMTGESGKQYGPILSTKTNFTIRLKKWEKQYEKKEVAPGWSNGIFYCTGYKDGLETVKWQLVSGKPHHFELVVAENVTFPYSTEILCGIHYQTKAYLDGERIQNPAPNTPFKKTLVFNSKKKYYDFVIDPGTSMDDKHTYGVKSYWRISVTGNSSSENKDEKNIVNADVKKISPHAFTGKQIKPAITVSANGVTLKKDTDYTIEYCDNKNIGKGSFVLTGKGKYKGTKTVEFDIVPTKSAVSKISAGKNKMKISWKKASTDQKISKYVLRYRINGTKKWTNKTFASTTSNSVIKKLKKGKVYETQVRCFKTVSGKKYYSAWSAKKLSKKIK